VYGGPRMFMQITEKGTMAIRSHLETMRASGREVPTEQANISVEKHNFKS
jgi:hypothetical protein